MNMIVKSHHSDPAMPFPKYPDLEGKVAVITAGSRGIGAATAAAFAENGAAVAAIGRDRQALDAVVDGIRERRGQAISVVSDCTVSADIDRLQKTVTNAFGDVDVLAAFAGGNGMPVPTADETPEHWRQVVDSDLTSTFITVHAFLPAMIARQRGAIITMSSAAARQAAHSSAAYAAAKAGVIAFTRHLANELAPLGIRVNCIAPSAIETDRLRSWTSYEQRAGLAASFPLRRIGQPADVAGAALYLASDASSWITGVTLDISGGKVMV